MSDWWFLTCLFYIFPICMILTKYLHLIFQIFSSVRTCYDKKIKDILYFIDFPIMSDSIMCGQIFQNKFDFYGSPLDSLFCYIIIYFINIILFCLFIYFVCCFLLFCFVWFFCFFVCFFFLSFRIFSLNLHFFKNCNYLL